MVPWRDHLARRPPVGGGHTLGVVELYARHGRVNRNDGAVAGGAMNEWYEIGTGSRNEDRLGRADARRRFRLRARLGFDHSACQREARNRPGPLPDGLAAPDRRLLEDLSKRR